MREHPVKPVENYTNPFLATAFVLLFSTLFALWAVFGMIPALVFAVGLNTLIPSRRG